MPFFQKRNYIIFGGNLWKQPTVEKSGRRFGNISQHQMRGQNIGTKKISRELFV